jgi:chemotaxis protein MotA
MLVVIGLLIVLFSVFGGFSLSGGHLLALFQPYELLMIGGAGLGTFIIANNSKVIRAAGVGIKNVLIGRTYNRQFNVQLLSLMFELTTKIRKEGVLAIENDVENFKESPLFTKYPLVQREPQVMEFLCDHLRLIITGRVEAMHLENLIDADIETFEVENELPIMAINRVADSLPAFGIVAAVMGVVHTMESIGVPPEVLGKLIARAMVGTFLGVLLGYGFIAPLASSLESRRASLIKVLQAIKVILLATVHNFAPTIGVEMARKLLYSTVRPNSQELEAIIKELKTAKVDDAAPEAKAETANE